MSVFTELSKYPCKKFQREINPKVTENEPLKNQFVENPSASWHTESVLSQRIAVKILCDRLQLLVDKRRNLMRRNRSRKKAATAGLSGRYTERLATQNISILSIEKGTKTMFLNSNGSTNI